MSKHKWTDKEVKHILDELSDMHKQQAAERAQLKAIAHAIKKLDQSVQKLAESKTAKPS
jgi:hypothetical protein